jgi:hypothetical protein
LLSNQSSRQNSSHSPSTVNEGSLTDVTIDLEEDQDERVEFEATEAVSSSSSSIELEPIEVQETRSLVTHPKSPAILSNIANNELEELPEQQVSLSPLHDAIC